ncbi:ciliary-associated calcium-binding coiled-coil protein 1 [Rhinatrema bivittatum]|uniref:ciliary-associated calcium-binding coiled-coil protein 1 n=1 Tax=Rhinatrema bivittatum TaxID=194408 RepID=UPI00112D73B9|nr:ciliary-associated calcium-binding coiled-coil protein 1 [Rhinatrema bivittatum]
MMIEEETSASLLQLQEEEELSDEPVKESSPESVFFSFPQISCLSELDVDGVQKKLEEFLNFKQRETSLKEAILLDYYVSGFWWAKEINFSLQQLFSFMNLLQILLDNLATKQMTLEENIKELWKVLVGLGQSSSENNGGIDVFTVDQTKALINYLRISLFQHYKLYEFLFYSLRDELVLGTEEAIEIIRPTTIPFPAPLEEGLSYDIYSKFMLLIPEIETTSEISVSAQQEVTEDTETTDIPLSAKPEEDILHDSKAKPMQEIEKPAGERTDSSGVDPIAGFTIEDVKSVLEQVTKDVIDTLQTDINEKLRVQEEAYTVRIDKLKKNKVL